MADKDVPMLDYEVRDVDEKKQASFESLGFRTSGASEEFSLEGRNVASASLERATGLLSPDDAIDIPAVHTNRF